MNFSVPNAPMVEPTESDVHQKIKKRRKRKQDEMGVDGMSAILIFIFRFVSGSDEIIR